jgi:tetratricopeptide (TPR) repeat protein
MLGRSEDPFRRVQAVSNLHHTFRLTAVIVLLAAAAAAAQQLSNPRESAQIRERAREPYVAGLEHMRQEAFEAARKAFETAIAIDPEFEMAHYMLGRAHLALKHYAPAAVALAKSRDLFVAQGSRQFIDKQEGQRHRRARLAELDDLIGNLRSATPQTYQIREQIRQLEERKRQVEDLDRARDLTPERQVPAFVSLSLGSAYFRLDRRDEAEQAFLAAVAADPKTGEAHNNLAVVYFETGRYAEAKASVRAAEKAGVRVHPELKAQINAKGG